MQTCSLQWSQWIYDCHRLEQKTYNHFLLLGAKKMLGFLPNVLQKIQDICVGLLQKSLCFLVHLPTRQWQRVGHGAVTKFGTPTPDGVAMCGWIFLIQSPPFWMIQRCFNPDSIPWKITRKNIIKKISKLKDKLVYWHDPVVSHLSSPTEPSDGLARFFGVCCRMCSTWAPSWVGALVGGHHHPKQDQKPLYKLYIYTYIYILCVWLYRWLHQPVHFSPFDHWNLRQTTSKNKSMTETGHGKHGQGSWVAMNGSSWQGLLRP